MMNKLNWQVISTQERNAAFESIKEAISINDGAILNFQLFSDLALSLVVEIPEKQVRGLYDALNEVASISQRAPEDLNPSSSASWWVLFHISFSKGKGELEVEIPEVPG